MPRPPHKNKHSAIEEKEKVISDAGHSFFTPEEIDKVKAPFEMLRSKTSASDQFSEEISIHPEDMGIHKAIGEEVDSGSLLSKGKWVAGEKSGSLEEQDLKDDADLLRFSADEEKSDFGWGYLEQIWIDIENTYYGWLSKAEIYSGYSFTRKDILLLLEIGRILQNYPVEDKPELLKQLVELGLRRSYARRPQDPIPNPLRDLRDRLRAINVMVEGQCDQETYVTVRGEFVTGVSNVYAMLELPPDFDSKDQEANHLIYKDYLSRIWGFIEDKHFGWLPKAERASEPDHEGDLGWIYYLGQGLGRMPLDKRAKLLQKILVHKIREFRRRDSESKLPWCLRALLAKVRLMKEHEQNFLRDKENPVLRSRRYEKNTGTVPLPDNARPKFDPTLSPGEIIRRDLIDGLGLTVEEAARRIGMDDVYLHHIVSGRKGLTLKNLAKLSVLFDECREKTGIQHTVKGFLDVQMERKLKSLDIAPHLIM
jgi:antitoxin component HigA of HigAB toxin-antitoxin module